MLAPNFFTAKVSSVEPHAKYMGVVYDQIVYLELDDGKKLSVFDQLCKAGAELEGRTVKVFVSIFGGELKKNDKKVKTMTETAPAHFNLCGQLVRHNQYRVVVK